MFSIGDVRTWTPTRLQGKEGAPIIEYEPASAGAILDARAACKIGKNEYDQDRFPFEILARTVSRIHNVAYRGKALELPEAIAARITSLRLLPPSWISGLTEQVVSESDIDQEEERQS